MGRVVARGKFFHILMQAQIYRVKRGKQAVKLNSISHQARCAPHLHMKVDPDPEELFFILASYAT